MKMPTPLKLAIVASGERQKDIAARVGIDETTLSRIVNGLHCADATKHAIADALGKTPDDLWPSGGMQAAA